MESHCSSPIAHDPTVIAAISCELHKTAQPLTILQGLLELMLMTGSNGEECRSSVERAAEEVQRLIACFDEVRKLVGLQRPALDVATFPLAMMVNDVLQTVQTDFDIAGITVTHAAGLTEGSIDVLVNASHSRLSNALHLALAALANCLPAGDEIRISLECDASNSTARIRTSSPHRIQSCAERDRLLGALTPKLHFAEVVLKSIGGELRVGETPDIVTITLPATASRSANSSAMGNTTHA